MVRAWILHPGLFSAERLEAAGAIVSRFEGAFLSIAHGTRLSFSTNLSCKVWAWLVANRPLYLCPAISGLFSCCLLIWCLASILVSAICSLCNFCHKLKNWYKNLTFYKKKGILWYLVFCRISQNWLYSFSNIEFA